MNKPKPQKPAWNLLPRYGQQEPQFNDGDDNYKMTAPASVETARIRERRQSDLDFIEYLKANSWLSEDSDVVEHFEEAWKALWNEYSTIRNAIDGEDLKDELFPTAKYSPGDYISDTRNLVVGDCFKIITEFKVVAKNNSGMKLKNLRTGYVESETMHRIDPYEWTYLGYNWMP